MSNKPGVRSVQMAVLKNIGSAKSPVNLGHGLGHSNGTDIGFIVIREPNPVSGATSSSKQQTRN